MTTPKKTVLVAGGAGYIGSHMVKALDRAGFDPLTLDDLSTGHRDAVLAGRFIEGHIGCPQTVHRLFQSEKVDAVILMAGSIQVGESVGNPALYYRNNVMHALPLLDAMKVHGVSNLVFSSTAAIFGEPLYCPIDEAHPIDPLNPYGRSKWMLEHILVDYEQAYGLRCACLRYFNAAGADPDGHLRERHSPETHLIPLALEVAQGKRPFLSLFGNNYDTQDGSCIRDYIHVSDLCEAHLLALQRLWEGATGFALNLGNGQGFSVWEVIQTVRAVTGHPVPVRILPRRLGDPARLVADSTKARAFLGWKPRYPSLTTMVEHAWEACIQER
jgi:UDP-glucose 4-epimerase